MPTVTLIDPIKDPRWNKFVEDHPFGLVYHLSSWKQVLTKTFNHMKGHYFVLIDENNQIKAGLPIYEVESWLTGNRMVSIPYATLCDPLISTSEEYIILLESIFHLFNEVESSYIEIRTLASEPLLS